MQLDHHDNKAINFVYNTTKGFSGHNKFKLHFVFLHDNKVSYHDNRSLQYPWTTKSVIVTVAIAIRPLGVCRECPYVTNRRNVGGRNAALLIKNTQVLLLYTFT